MTGLHVNVGPAADCVSLNKLSLPSLNLCFLICDTGDINVTCTPDLAVVTI